MLIGYNMIIIIINLDYWLLLFCFLVCLFSLDLITRGKECITQRKDITSSSLPVYIHVDAFR